MHDKTSNFLQILHDKKCNFLKNCMIYRAIFVFLRQKKQNIHAKPHQIIPYSWKSRQWNFSDLFMTLLIGKTD